MQNAVFVGFLPWRSHIPRWFPGYQHHFVSRRPVELFLSSSLLRLLFLRPHVYVWGKKYPAALRILCKALGLSFYHVEDGFIRSVGLGSLGAAPVSILVDSRALHFDCHRPSDLEVILETHDFENDQELMANAEKALSLLRVYNVNKYNLAGDRTIDVGSLASERILVVGQVPGDASLRYGGRRPLCNADLLSTAIADHPQATIYYKPHPATRIDLQVDELLSSQACHDVIVLDGDIAAHTAIEACSLVYVNTSLLGFEALLRGKPVTCLGAPFYAGWGLTNDRMRIDRRRRRLSLMELFAGSYVAYPRYFNPDDGSPIAIVDAIRLLAGGRASRG